MQALRTARHLARLVLAWFALSLGVAIASPLVNPQSFELLCSGSGAMKLLVKDVDGNPPDASATLDCPLCATTGAPPPSVDVHVAQPQPLGQACASIPAARIAALTAAPLPARGPPSLLSI